MRPLLFLLLFAPAFTQTLTFKHVAIVNPDSDAPQFDQTVLIKNGWITEIGKNIRIPKDSKVVDGTGKFLIPGLWDMHTHVAGISADPAWGQTLLRQYLAYGITSIRDMAGNVDTLVAWKRSQAEGRLLSPRMFISGPFVDGSKEGFDHPADVIEAGTPEAGRAAVRQLKNKGVDFIKVGSQLSRQTFFAIAEECHQQKIPFLGHVPNSVTPFEASNAGMKSEEHLFGVALSISSEEEELRQQIAAARAHNDSGAYSSAVIEMQKTMDERKAAELFGIFKRNGTWITPTLSWTQITSTLSQRTDRPELKRLPIALQTKWAPGQRLSSPTGEAYYRRKLQSDLRIVAMMNKSGVRILAGSDSLDPYVFPGDSLHLELELLVQAGLSTTAALRAATLGASEFFNLQHDLGTVAKGKRADFVLLSANPLADIRNTRKIEAVIQNGQLMTPEDILRPKM